MRSVSEAAKIAAGGEADPVPLTQAREAWPWWKWAILLACIALPVGCWVRREIGRREAASPPATARPGWQDVYSPPSTMPVRLPRPTARNVMEVLWVAPPFAGVIGVNGYEMVRAGDRVGDAAVLDVLPGGVYAGSPVEFYRVRIEPPIIRYSGDDERGPSNRSGRSASERRRAGGVPSTFSRFRGNASNPS